MKLTSLALALSVPAIVAAAETPAAQECAELKDLISAQSRMEFSMLAMENPAPANKEDAMAQMTYLFSLMDAMRGSALETAKAITSNETADEKAIELGARLEVYVGLNMTISIVGNSTEYTEEEIATLDDKAAAGLEIDKLLSLELRRLNENDYYGSDMLKAVIDYLQNAFGDPEATEEAPQD